MAEKAEQLTREKINRILSSLLVIIGRQRPSAAPTRLKKQQVLFAVLLGPGLVFNNDFSCFLSSSIPGHSGSGFHQTSYNMK